MSTDEKADAELATATIGTRQRKRGKPKWKVSQVISNRAAMVKILARVILFEALCHLGRPNVDRSVVQLGKELVGMARITLAEWVNRGEKGKDG